MGTSSFSETIQYSGFISRVGLRQCERQLASTRIVTTHPPVEMVRLSLLWEAPEVNPINHKARSIPVLNVVNMYGRVFFFCKSHRHLVELPFPCSRPAPAHFFQTGRLTVL